MVTCISEGKFIVWRRNDGYVGATAGRMPQDYQISDGKTLGQWVTFVKISEHERWSEAYAVIETERSSNGATAQKDSNG
jgi:hypothetical protein